MKKTLVLLTLVATMLLSGCTMYKEVPYLQNIDDIDLSPAKYLYDAKIMPKDILNIVVLYPEDPQVASAFSLYGGQNGYAGGSAMQQETMRYIVSNDGTIEFPIIGRIKVVGKTKDELEDMIATRLTGTYFKKRPLIKASMANYRFCVLGETGSGIYTVPNGKINILEAIAMAGDLTLQARRDNIRLIREEADGTKITVTLNLNDANIINSPYYQIQQNDIIYVTPNKIKARTNDLTNINQWVSYTSMFLSLATAIFMLTKLK